MPGGGVGPKNASAFPTISWVLLAYTFAEFVRAACRSASLESDTNAGPAVQTTWSVFPAWIAAHSVVATTPTKFFFCTVCTNPGIVCAAANDPASNMLKVAFLGFVAAPPLTLRNTRP
jgi:hypothetical protein